MKVLHRYLLREFLSIFGLSMAMFSSIYLLVEFFERVDDFIEHQAKVVDATSYFVYKLPLIFTQVAPFAILLATILTLSLKARTHELTAMRSAGVGVGRLAAPFIGSAVVLSLLLFAAYEVIVPAANVLVERTMREKISGKTPRGVFRSNDLWYRDQGSTIWHVRYFHKPTGSLHGVTLYTFDDRHQLRQRLDAERAVFGNGRWLFTKVFLHEFSSKGGYRVDHAPELVRTLPERPGDFLQLRKAPESMTLREIYTFVQRAREHGLDDTHYSVAMQNKFAQPWAPILMVLIGLPFSQRTSRRGSASLGIAVSLLLTLAYFVLLSVSLSAGYSGLLPPFLAAWVPNLIFAATAVYMLRSE